MTKNTYTYAVISIFDREDWDPAHFECGYSMWLHPTCDILAIPHTKTKLFHLALHIVFICEVIDPDESVREKTKNLWRRV